MDRLAPEELREKVAQAVLVKILRGLRPQCAAVLFPEAEGLRVWAARGVKSPSALAQDLTVLEVLKTKHSITRERGYCSIMCVPLLDWGQGVEALFYAQSASGRFFQQREMDWLDALASKAREKLWGPEPPEPADGDDTGRSLTHAAQEVLDTVVEVLSPERAAIFFQEPPNQELAVLASHQLPRENFLTEAPVSFALLESLWERGEPVTIVDAQQHECADLEGVKEHGIRSVAACPLFDQENKVRGLLYLDSCQEAGLFRSRELNLLRQLGEKLANEWPAALAVHKPSEEDWSAVLDSLSKTKSNRQISGWEVLLESLARNDGEAPDPSRPTEELARPIELEAFIPRFSEPDDDNLIFEFDETESDDEPGDLPEVVPVPRVEKIKARPEPEWIEETPEATGADLPPALELVTINKLFRGKALFQRSLRGRKGSTPRAEAGDEEEAPDEPPTSEPDAHAPASELEQPAETPLGAPTVVFASETVRLGMPPPEAWEPVAEPAQTSWEAPSPGEQAEESEWGPWVNMAMAAEPTFTSAEEEPDGESFDEALLDDYPEEFDLQAPTGEPAMPEQESPVEATPTAWMDEPQSAWPAAEPAWDWPAEGEAATGPDLEPRIELEPPPEFVERAVLESEPEEGAVEEVEAEAAEVEAEPEEWTAEEVEAEPELEQVEPEVDETEPEELAAEPEAEQVEAEPEVEQVEAEPEVDETEPEELAAEAGVAETESEVGEVEPEEWTAEPEVDETQPEELAAEAEVDETEPEAEEMAAEPEVDETEPEPEEWAAEPEIEQDEAEHEELAAESSVEEAEVSEEMAVEAEPEPDEPFEPEPEFEPYPEPGRVSPGNDASWESQESVVEVVVEETRAMAFDSLELAVEPTMEEAGRTLAPVPVAPPPAPSLFERILRWIGLKSTPEGPVPVPVRVNGRVLVERPVPGRVAPTEIVLHFPQARLRMVLELEHGQTEYDFSANFTSDRVPPTASLTLRKEGYHPVKLTGIRLVDGQAQVPDVTLLPEGQGG